MTKKKMTRTRQNNKKSSKPRKQQSKVRTKREEKSIGSQLGALVGHGIQKFGESVFNRIMGKGDYTLQDNLPDIRKNSLFQSGNYNKPPSFSSNQGFLFEHCEYIQDIVSSSSANTFSTTTLTCNPANATTFPWLANLASNFESYEIEGMIYRFESTCGDSVASTNTSLGTVMGYFAYDTLDATVLSKNVLLQYEGSVDTVTSKSFLLGVECDKSKLVSPRLYVGSPPSGSDAKSYNWGNLVIATSGLQGTSVTVGELYVHYRIRFYTAKQQSAASSINASFGGVTANNPFGTSVLSQFGSLNVIYVSSTVLKVTNMNPGTKYSMFYQCVAPATASHTSGSWAYTGATPYLQLNGGSLAQLGATSGAGNYFTVENVITASSNTVTITSSWVHTATSPTSVQLIIAPYDNVTL